MATDTRVANLIINKGLTKSELNEKYQQGLIGDNELSVVDTEETVFQVDEMPTASAANVDSIVQYAGATTEDYTQGYFYQCEATYADPTVTASQTSGSDLSDITVNKDVYIEAMHPEEGDSVDFVADVMDDYVTPDRFEMGGEQFVLEMSTFLSYCKLNVYSGDWSTDVGTVSVNYDADNDTWTIAALDAGYNTLGSAGGMTPQSAGIMYSTLPSTGSYTVNLVYTPQRLAWRVDGAILAYGDLSGVGISYTGTPVTGDTITATYTGRTISGYYWTQINVQPGGGGGDTGIDWKTAVDLPSTYSGGMWYCAPAFVVSGGLPDGTYEMYYQVKTRSNTYEQSAPSGVATLKIIVRLYYENDLPTMMGTIAPVIDGGWAPSDNYTIAARSVYNVFHIDQNNNFVMDPKNSLPFISDLGDYGNIYVPDCFRLSAIRNINTGDEYIATGVEPDGNYPYYSRNYGGTLAMSNLQQPQSIPVYNLTADLSFSDNDQWISTGEFIPTAGRGASCSEFDVSLESSNGGKWHIISENTHSSYRITVLDASGDLANVQIGYSSTNSIYLHLNTPAGSSGTIYMRMGVKGASQSVWYNWASQPSGFTPFTLSTVGADITPNNYGAILQYTGTTNANYTNGYFYKANGTPTTVQASIDCNEISSYGNIITCDVNSLISAIAAHTGWDIEYVKQRLSGVSEWQGIQQTGYLYWNQWGSFGENPSMLSCFTFTGGTQAESDTIQWVTNNYLPAHTVIVNQSWDRVDVQPGAAYTAGNGISITNNEIAVADPVLVNNPTGTSSVNIKGSDNSQSNSVAVGSGSSVTNNQAVAIGWSSQAGYDCTAVGARSLAYDDYSVAIGFGATVPYGVAYAIQLGNGTNNTSGTMAVALSADGSSWTNYELLSSNGTIPEARLADTTNAQQGDVLTLDSNLNAVWQAGGSGGLPSQTGNSGKFLTTDGTNASWGQLLIDTNRRSVVIGNTTKNSPNQIANIVIGGRPFTSNSAEFNSQCICIGDDSLSKGQYGITIGMSSEISNANAVYGIAIGYNSKVSASNAIQLGYYKTNSDANTFKVGNENGNFEIMSADGTIPTARLTKVNTTITLASANWSANSQTVNVTGMTATGVVLVSPDPTDQADYTSAGILCTAQAAGTLTFTCDSVPSGDIDVNVVML